MFSTSRLVRFGVLVLAAGALAACAVTMHVDSFTERGAEFNRYRTYAFAPPDLYSTGDPRLDNNPFFQGRAQAAVEKGLAARGYEKAASDESDLVIHFHASMSQDLDVNEIDRNFGYCTNQDCRSFVYDAGTLLLDLVDGRSNKLVWRGWVEGSMNEFVDNQDRLEQRLDESIARILATLPNRS